MSSSKRFRVKQGSPKGVAVYSRDMNIVNSVSTALSEKLESESSTDYVAIQQTSVSSMDNVCIASVLDIAMVGHSSVRVREAIARLKIKEPTHPIFLIGKKEQLDAAMKHEGTRKMVDGQFSLPLSAEDVIPSLDAALNSNVSVETAPVSTSNGFNVRYIIGTVIALTLISYWYVTSTEADLQTPMPSPVALDEKIAPQSAQENSKNDIEGESRDAQLKSDTPQEVIQLNDEILVNASQANQIRDAMESKVVPQFNEDGGSVGFETNEFNAPKPLFNEYQEEVLVKARSALKDGFIVGPDGASAWHYYRQALEIDQFGERSDEQKNSVLGELKSEFNLAVELGKFGRSRSILRVFKDLDPLHTSISDMQLRFEQRFKKASP